MHTDVIIIDAQYLCGKVIAELELLEESRQEHSAEEKNDTPEENIGNIGSMRATSTAHKFPFLFNTVLQIDRGQSFMFIK